MKEVSEHIKKVTGYVTLQEAMDVMDDTNTKSYIEKICDKTVDVKQRRAEWHRLNAWMTEMLGFYREKITGYTRDIDQHIKTMRKVSEEHSTLMSLPLNTKRQELIEKAIHFGINLEVNAIEEASLENSKPLIKEFFRKSDACLYILGWLRECVKDSLFGETVIYRCPNSDCGKLSKIESDVDLRDKKARACPFCLTLLTGKDVVDPKLQVELYPSTKPLGMLGSNATCYCSHCNHDVKGDPAAPCVQQTCPDCGEQLATRLKLGNEDPKKRYDYGNFDRSKGLKP